VRPLCSISKLYIQEACINKRNNELGLNSFGLPLCAAAVDGSASVCEQVFASGKLFPARMLVSLRRCTQ
jgi:hypothetical protein